MKNLGPNIKALKDPKDHFTKDLYVAFIEMRWRDVLLLFTLFYTCINLSFAFLYYIDVEHINNAQSFFDCFNFSVQTFASIGYGIIHPSGAYLNTIVFIQSVVSIVSVAMITGISFAKISRPYAKIIFSKNIVLSDFDGKKTLSLRIANRRGNTIVEGKVRFSIIAFERTLEGETIRRVYDLPLLRDKTPFFRLSWSLFHVIDDKSPFYQLDKHNTNIERISVSVTGHDETFSSKIYARHNYEISSIKENYYFEDIMSKDTQGEISIDLSKFHSLRSKNNPQISPTRADNTKPENT